MDKIESILKKGKNNPTDRVFLQIFTGAKDREIRRAIAEARTRGIPIVNIGEGYFIATSEDIAEVEDYVRAEKSRLRSQARALKHMSAWIEDVKHGRMV